MSQIAEENEQALAQLYDATSGAVYGFSLRILKDPSSAEEVTIEVYLQVWRTAKRYDPQRGTVSSWLMTLARSRAIDCLRARKSRRAELEQDVNEVAGLCDTRPSPEQASFDAARTRIIRNAMAALSPDQRQAIESAYFSGFSHSEIASRSGLPLGTVKTRIRSGMLQLRELLGPYAAEI
jgi:RNA polymerase sigma-70 factor (ECF subfamily)